MKQLLLPAILLINQLAFPKKLLLFGLVVLIPATFHTIYTVSIIHKEMLTINTELATVRYAQEINKLLVLVFEYRMAEFNEETTASLTNKVAKIDSTLQSLEPSLFVVDKKIIAVKTAQLFIDWYNLKSLKFEDKKEEWRANSVLLTKIAILSKHIIDQTFLDADPQIRKMLDAFSSDLYLVLETIQKPPTANLKLNLHTSLGTQLEQLLEQKEKGLFKKNSIYIGIIFFVIVLVGYFFLAFYRAIIDSLGKLSLAFSNVKKGKLETRLYINTKDEIGVLATHFNAMVQELETAQKVLTQNAQDLKLLATALEKVANGIVISDSNKKIVWANQMIYQITGYLVSEIIGENVNIFSPKGSSEIITDIETTISNGKTWKGELVRKRKNGTLYDEEISVTPVNSNNDTSETYYVSVRQDISKRKQMTLALKESEARFKSAFENAAVGQMMINLEGEIFNVNQAICKLFSTKKRIFIGKRFIDLLYQEQDIKKFNYYKNLLSGNQQNYYAEQQFIYDDHQIFWAALSLSTVQDATGNILFIVAQLQDITYSKWTEKALIQEKKKAQMYFEVAGVILLTLNTRGEVVLINKEGRKILGYETAELVGKDWFATCFPDSHSELMKEMYKDMISNNINNYAKIETPVITKNGKKIIVVWNNSIFIDENGEVKGVISSGEDITERKISEIALQKSQTNLATAQQLAHIGSWELDIATNKMEWSDELFRIFGLSDHKLQPTYESFIGRIYPEDQQKTERTFKKAIEQKQDFRVSYTIIHTNGTARVIASQGKVALGEHGKKVVKLFGTAQDITEQKRLEGKVFAQEKALQRKLKIEVAERTLELEAEKNKIERINNNIVSSITYARRIQVALLPQVKEIKEDLPNSFIYFRPKDIVSGDFYWVGRINKKIIVAAVDCTGHGIPGALMHMIGNSLLDEIIYQRKITAPDNILHELHIGIRTALKQSISDNKDGMDLSICVINENEKTLVYSGARNPLVYVQENKLHQIKADRTSIGGEQKEKDRVFTKHTIFFKKPTTFYIYTDGFQDQFGGEGKGRKFMSPKFRELLHKISEEEIQTQELFLDKTLSEWMGFHHKQIDDILVMGFCLQ